MTETIRNAVLAVWLIAGTLGCGPAEELAEPADLSSQSQELASLNGLSANGLSANGLSANGLSANGLSANGLSANGLSAASFAAWFEGDPALANMVMRYIVRCAVPAGETRSYASPQTGQSYTWSGGLGLAPSWAHGAPAHRTEQQLITACLLAHVNRYGLSISISVLGRDAEGDVIPFSNSELTNWGEREACFFGNLFTNEGLYFGVDRLIGNESMYLTRACAGLDDGGSTNPATSCAPLRYVGACALNCFPDLLAGPFYNVCWRNGVAYRALTTRMRTSDYAELFPDGD